MIIDKLEMVNFGPYKGKHDLALGLGQHPLVVIHGQNMAGKTTIINAVRWALYGVAKDRRGKPLNTRLLINDDAFNEGQKFVSVSLTLRVPEEDDATYELRRQHQCKAGASGGIESDYEKIREITRDGHVESPAYFDEAVSSLMPEGISRFFLFDGELLNEYEELVREGGQREAEAVKQAVEMILGLPAARQGRDDVQALKTDVSRRLRRAAADDQRFQEATQRLEDLEKEKARLLAEKGEIEDELRDALAEIRRLDESLKNFEESRADAGRREELIKRMQELEKRRKEGMQRRRELARDLWRDVLAPRLERETERLDRERAEREEATAQLQGSQRALAKLQRSVVDGVCDQCGQSLPDAGRARARAEIGDLEREIEILQPRADVERTREVSRIIGQLRKVAPAGKVDAVRLVEQDLSKIAIDTHRTKTQIQAVDERLGSINTEQMLAYDEEKRRYEGLAAKARTSLDQVSAQLSQVDTETQRQQSIVLQNKSPVFASLSRELRTLEALEDVYTRAVDALADELRSEVEKRASEIFAELTTDPTYSGLSINTNYGLTILRADGTPAMQRSAGAEQVVALSLLGALNSLATKTGPVIMDTPFGRLDRTHRANILRYLPTMADQVVLLVHDGEVDPGVDLAEIRGQIDAEYRIAHPTSSCSELVRETLDRG